MCIRDRDFRATVNGASCAELNPAPEPNSSYWVRVFENAWPSTTIAEPRKLNSEPQALSLIHI